MLYAILSESGFCLFGHSIYTDDVDIAKAAFNEHEFSEYYRIFVFEDSLAPVLKFAYEVVIQGCCGDDGHLAVYRALIKQGGKVVSNI